MAEEVTIFGLSTNEFIFVWGVILLVGVWWLEGRS